jgi:hypothetical protein
MARPLRIEYPGAYYHVMNRGNRQEDIFKSDYDREKFLDYLAILSGRFSIKIHTYFFNDQPLSFADRNT